MINSKNALNKGKRNGNNKSKINNNIIKIKIKIYLIYNNKKKAN